MISDTLLLLREYGQALKQVQTLTAENATLTARLAEKDKQLAAVVEEIGRMKHILRDNGVYVIPSKYPGGRAAWNE